MAERAWPFENVEEGGRIRNPEDFLERRRDVEAVVIRIGLHDSQLVLVDGSGDWLRWVYHSNDEALEVARSLGVPVHEGEYTEEMRVRINGFRRSARDYDKGAYPEQGAVGPVIPYPENRPRRLQDAGREASTPAESSD